MAARRLGQGALGGIAGGGGSAGAAALERASTLPIGSDDDRPGSEDIPGHASPPTLG